MKQRISWRLKRWIAHKREFYYFIKPSLVKRKVHCYRYRDKFSDGFCAYRWVCLWAPNRSRNLRRLCTTNPAPLGRKAWGSIILRKFFSEIRYTVYLRFANKLLHNFSETIWKDPLIWITVDGTFLVPFILCLVFRLPLEHLGIYSKIQWPVIDALANLCYNILKRQLKCRLLYRFLRKK